MQNSLPLMSTYSYLPVNLVKGEGSYLFDDNGNNIEYRLEENGLVKQAANGHGGTLHSMEKCGVIQEMKDYKIKGMNIYPIKSKEVSSTSCMVTTI